MIFFLVLDKVQFNIQADAHNPVPRIENINSRIFLRHPVCNSGNSKWNLSNPG